MRQVSWLVLVVGLLSPLRLSAAEPVPHWIAAPGATAGGWAYFRKRVEISKPVTAARLVAAASGVGGDCFLDGKYLCEFEPNDPLVKLDVTSEFSRGTHVLSVRSRGATA